MGGQGEQGASNVLFGAEQISENAQKKWQSKRDEPNGGTQGDEENKKKSGMAAKVMIKPRIFEMYLYMNVNVRWHGIELLILH